MIAEESKPRRLPDNAYTELKPGEEYRPILDPEKRYPEATPYSVFWGLLMAALFSAAAAYLGLKIGQVFEAAIPIAIIAVGLSTALKRSNALGENVIIQSIGANSGVIVAGAIFTIPALYILELDAEFYKIFLASLLGGFLGILFLIPFRKHFVSDMHGKYPFPEATATTEVLTAGERGGKQALVLVVSGAVGGAYDFVVSSFGAWAEVVTSRAVPYGEKIAEKWKLVFSMNIGAAVTGLGYIVGLKYAAIIAAGSFLAWYGFIPVASYFGEFVEVPIGAGVTTLLRDMTPEQIFSAYVRHIGIGGIAMAGLIGVIKSSGVIGSSIRMAAREIFGGKATVERSALRTKRDLPMAIVAGGLVLATIVTFIFFQFGVVENFGFALVGLAIVLVVAFLFTTVAAQAIAIVGTNPVSGMTLMTLILASIVLLGVGLKGEAGMAAALIIGGVVCTALSMAGGFITDLKVGYWIGASPKKQEGWKFVGTLVAAASVGGVIMVLNETYGFTGEGALVAPQANAMAAVIEPLMSEQPAPWTLYLAGAFIALLLHMIKVPALAFALGMYIPLELNTPILAGGIISYIVQTRSKDEALNKARRERGTLVASGFIAGGALMGVVSALIRFAGADLSLGEWSESIGAERLGALMFLLLAAYFTYDSMRATKEE
ncbi:MAG: oligopeptide transporter, OPT family [Ignavibacteriales bacterium]|jgi:putative OPT family oligopeptide transporter|nr:oligopeptide transporter, OPT family [Ignavibacteriales bacterium]